MKHAFFKTTLAAFAVLLAGTFTNAPAVAGDISVHAPWARASAGMAKAGGAFMVIKNTGHADDKLIAAKADVSDTVELHTHIMEDGVMKMREVPFIAVPKMGAVKLKPGGFHVMFLGLKAPLQEKAEFPLTLVFENAGEVSVDVVVMGPGHMGGADKGMGMDMGKGMGEGMGEGMGHGHGDDKKMH